MPTRETLQKLLKYHRKTGLLTYRTYRSHFTRGHIAGWLNRKGYIELKIDKRCLKAHRVIWTMLRAPIPKGMQLDHIDGNRSNNRLNNLQLVTNIDNSHNRKLAKNNTSGANGVYWRKNRKHWYVLIYVNGKRIMVGSFKNFDDAQKARDHADRQHQFFRLHGKRKATPESVARAESAQVVSRVRSSAGS